MLKIVLFANTDWYLYNFRSALALTLRDSGFDVLLVSPEGPYAQRLVDMGLRWVPAPMSRRSLNPWRELRFFNWLRKLIRDEQVDLIHGFTIKCAVYGSLAARSTLRRSGAPARIGAVAGLGYVFTSRQLKARILRPVVAGLLRLALGGQGARVILQNPDDVELFRKARMAAPGKIRLIRGSGVDCSRFLPRSNSGQVEGGPLGRMRVVLPARLLWDKGIGDYVAAARILRAEGRAIDFLLAGDPDAGNPAAVPESVLREWVEEGCIQWLGHVDDMPELFRSVDVMVLPTVYGEGVPRGLIEAGASGLALVATDMPGCREVISHGVEGLLVPPKDARSLAAAIARFQDDPSLRQRLGMAARDKVLRDFEEAGVIERTIAVYREVLGR